MRKEPLQITAGDSVSWERSFDGYPASDGWTASCWLTNESNNHKIGSVPDGDGFKFTATSVATAAFAPGRYRYQIKVTKREGLENTVVTIESGKTIDILPDFSSGPLDGRTQAEVALDAVRATIAKKATKDQLSITVEGRTIQRMSFEDLIKAEKHLSTQVAREARAARGQSAGGIRKIRTRFTR